MEYALPTLPRGSIEPANGLQFFVHFFLLSPLIYSRSIGGLIRLGELLTKRADSFFL